MKYFITIVIGVGLVMMLHAARFKAVENITGEYIDHVQKTTTDMQIKLLDKQEKAKADAYNAEKVKVLVKARDTKTCMKILNTNVIDNEVIECNKDHYVELRRDEVEKFKKENKL